MRPVVAVLAGAAVAALLGRAAGAVGGLVAAVGTGWYLSRLEPAAVRAERAACAAELPYALDLLAAALRAGQPTRRAVEVVGDAFDGPLGERLGRVGRALGLGLPPERAWLVLADLPGGGRLVNAVARSADSGAALSATFTRLADDQRAQCAAAVEALRRFDGPDQGAAVRLREEDGMNTAEYAVGTLAAVAFAGILLKVLTSDWVQAALTALVERALR